MKNIVACTKTSLESICRENIGKYSKMSIWMNIIFTKPVDEQPATFLRREINVEISFRPATENWEPLLGKNLLSQPEAKLIKQKIVPTRFSTIETMK